MRHKSNQRHLGLKQRIQGDLQGRLALDDGAIEEDRGGKDVFPLGAGGVESGEIPENVVTLAAGLYGLGVARVGIEPFGEEVLGIPVLLGARVLQAGEDTGAGALPIGGEYWLPDGEDDQARG